MFEWLFKYPPTVFLHGQLVLRSAWPRWPLALGVIAVGLAAGLGAARAARFGYAASRARWRLPLIWLAQWSMAALVLLLLWRPAIAVSELVPQANIIAVLVDDSRSMGIAEQGVTRMQQVVPGPAGRAGSQASAVPFRPGCTGLIPAWCGCRDSACRAAPPTVPPRISMRC